MRDTVTITLGDGRVFRAVMTDMKVTQRTKTMQTAAGHDYRVAIGGPNGTIKFDNLEEVELLPPSPMAPEPVSAAADEEAPEWGAYA